MRGRHPAVGASSHHVLHCIADGRAIGGRGERSPDSSALGDTATLLGLESTMEMVDRSGEANDVREVVSWRRIIRSWVGRTGS